MVKAMSKAVLDAAWASDLYCAEINELYYDAAKYEGETEWLKTYYRIQDICKSAGFYG